MKNGVLRRGAGNAGKHVWPLVLLYQNGRTQRNLYRRSYVVENMGGPSAGLSDRVEKRFADLTGDKWTLAELTS